MVHLLCKFFHKTPREIREEPISDMMTTLTVMSTINKVEKKRSKGKFKTATQ